MVRRGHAANCITLASAIALALGACAQQPVGWTKDGMTLDQLNADKKSCLAQSNDYSFLTMGGMGSNSPGLMGGSSSVATRQQGDIYSTCMQSLGYSQTVGPQKPTGAQSPQPQQ